jgi:alpha-beta hydrolase superfamily lysophospholipase
MGNVEREIGSATMAGEGWVESDAPITVAGVEIASRLTLPAAAPRGAILLIPGSLFVDADGNIPAMGMMPNTTCDLARRLASLGFASLRMAKVGPGTGSRTVDEAAAVRHADFATRVEAAEAGLRAMRTKVPGGPAVVAGHSEGAVVASLLAVSDARFALDGVVSLAGPALRIFDIMREQVAHGQAGQRDPDLSVFDLAVAALRAGEPIPEETRADPQSGMLSHLPPPAINYLCGVDAVDPVEALARVPLPVLLVQGGRDGSVRPGHAHRLLAGRGPAPTELAEFPTLTHFFKAAPATLTPMETMMVGGDTDPGVADAIAGWARRLPGARASS